MKRIALLVGLLATLLMASMATAQSFTEFTPNVFAEGCDLTVTFTATEPGDYTVSIFDDGSEVFNQTQTLDGGATGTFVYSATFVGSLSPEVAVQIFRDGFSTFLFDYEGELGFDAECSGILSGLTAPACNGAAPPFAAGGSVIVPGELHWSNFSGASTGVVLMPEKTVIVYGIDAAGEYWYVLYACKFYWMEVGTLAPNFDNVWNGKPLPADNIIDF